LPRVFQESSESSREEGDIEHEILEALKSVTIVGGLEESLQGFQRQFSPLAPTFVLINDSEKEEHVERRATNKEEKAKQLVEIEQPTYFSSIPIEGRFFNVEGDSPDILVTIPTKAWSKYMMRHKRRNKWRKVVHLPK